VKAGSICVAALASIEVSRGMWLDFLQLMTTNATSEPYNANIRFAAMLTLEFFSDFMV